MVEVRGQVPFEAGVTVRACEPERDRHSLPSYFLVDSRSRALTAIAQMFETQVKYSQVRTKKAELPDK